MNFWEALWSVPVFLATFVFSPLIVMVIIILLIPAILVYTIHIVTDPWLSWRRWLMIPAAIVAIWLIIALATFVSSNFSPLSWY